ncbi:hypothetical protein D3C85_1226720 [compost metagenome]
MEIRQRMAGSQGPGQGGFAQGLRVPSTGAVFGLQHLALAPQGAILQQGVGEHIQQPRQGVLQTLRRHFAEEAGAARTGAGVDPAAQALDEGDQPLAGRKAPAAEKDQVFEEVRQPRMFGRFVMTAAAHLHHRSGQRGARLMHQTHPQAIGQTEVQGRLRFLGFDEGGHGTAGHRGSSAVASIATKGSAILLWA